MAVRQVSEMLDVIVEPLYDTNFIPTAGTAGPLAFFAIPRGQGTSVFATASTKTLADTNMDLAAQLPAGFNFRVLGFRIVPSFNITVADATLALNGAVFVFTIGAKDFLRVPARLLPAGVGVVSATTTVASLGMATMQTGYTVGKKPFDLASSQNFGVTIQWPGGAGQAVTTTMAGGTTAGAAGLPLTVVLDGFKYRYAQ